MKDAVLKSALQLGPNACAGVLLPYPLQGPYDYKLPSGVKVARGLLVTAPLGPREALGAVWGEAEGTVGDNRLKYATPLDGNPVLPADLCDFIDWVADYTLNYPGMVLAMALRSRQAFEPGLPRTAYYPRQRDAQAPDARARACSRSRATASRAACPRSPRKRT